MQLLMESARYVSIAIGNVINLLMPEIVIIGGTLTHNYPPYFNQIKERALNRTLSSFTENIQIKQSELGMFGGPRDSQQGLILSPSNLPHWDKVDVRRPIGYNQMGSFEGFCSGGGIARLAQSMVRERMDIGDALPSII